MHTTAVTASQRMPAGQLSMRTMVVTAVACTPFRVHNTFRICFSHISGFAIFGGFQHSCSEHGLPVAEVNETSLDLSSFKCLDGLIHCHL